MVDPMTLHTAIMIVALLSGFIAMARFRQSQALVMPLIAITFLVLDGRGADATLRNCFAGFAPIAVVFTAIAICAHQIQRSGAFQVVGSLLGSLIGHIGLRRPKYIVMMVTALVLLLTSTIAALFHNITAIMVMTPIAIAICVSYKLPSRWLLCGALVASNLGGFSTAWGDTPNILEARVWDLSHGDFAGEILPVNLLILALLVIAVAALMGRDAHRAEALLSPIQIAERGTDFGTLATEVEIDRRLLSVGLAGLIGFILVQGINRDWEIAAGAAAILFAVASDRPQHRLEALHSLGLDVYLILLSVFVIAHTLGKSMLGSQLHNIISVTGGATWAVAVSSYVGTMLTEAASWAAAAAPITHRIKSAHSAAWALGGGICAGSSSLLTAASAGVILWTESRRFPGHEVEFQTYLPFGLGASLLMLGAYIIILTTLETLGWII